MASPPVKDGIRLSKMSPAFLHGNSTSHTWAFSAIAEIIDNSYDPDADAKTLTIDFVKEKNHNAIIFLDNGNGMSTEKLHHMLSFGYCEKKELNGHAPVGHYGNGFKSGSMRLGKSALVFTVDKNTMSVGLLSQTYLKKIQSDTVVVPIVTWNKQSKTRQTGMKESLKAILNFTFFNSEVELLEQCNEIMTQPESSTKCTGTKIMLYELKRGSDNRLELDFESDPRDVINSDHYAIDEADQVANRPIREYVPTYRKSLREYCSILYLKPRMKISLRGKKVKTKYLMKTLGKMETDSYKPKWLPNPVRLSFGFNDENVNDYGCMLYHRNRLIKAYERVGCQKQNSGEGVVGVAQVDFLQPTHIKQDFNKTDHYNSFISAVGQKLNDYFNEKTYGKSASIAASVNKPDKWTWAQCDNCSKFRRLPLGFTDDDLPDKWYCHLNPDSTHNRCDIEMEPEDEDDVLCGRSGASYEKTVKKTMEQEKAKAREDEAKKKLEADKKYKVMEQEVEKLRKMVSNSQPAASTVHNDAALRKQLDEAKRQEEERRKVIAQLQGQTKEIDRQKRQFQGPATKVRPLIQVGNLIAKPSTITSSTTPPTPRLIASQPIASTSSTPPSLLHNHPDGPVVKRIKLEQAETVIVIDDSDGSESMETEDIKPDISQLTPARQVVTCSTSTQTKPDELVESDFSEKDSKEKLNKLRSNVSKLLSLIVPDVELGDMNNIDNILIEMIKVNSSQS